MTDNEERNDKIEKDISLGSEIKIDREVLDETIKKRINITVKTFTNNLETSLGELGYKATVKVDVLFGRED